MFERRAVDGLVCVHKRIQRDGEGERVRVTEGERERESELQKEREREKRERVSLSPIGIRLPSPDCQTCDLGHRTLCVTLP